MSEPRIDELARELRATAPTAPPELRERVRALPEPGPRRTFRTRLRPALAIAAATAVTLGVGAAVVDGLRGGSGSSADRAASRVRVPESMHGAAKIPGAVQGSESSDRLAIPPSARLQNYGAALRLRVRDADRLSDAMKQAIRDTRRLGGYVVSARYAQGVEGDASLDVRVPIGRVQDALVRFSSLGTIVSQRISLQDLQPQADRLSKSIARRGRRIAELEAKGDLTATERAELAALRAELVRLTRRRASVVKEGTYAKVSLGLTTRKAAPVEKNEQGAFGNFVDDAGNILGKEAVAVLYALVVAGPFALLAALVLLGERMRRRRANQILLERAGSR
jgi:Domain of unknown function (DUF4349)